MVDILVTRACMQPTFGMDPNQMLLAKDVAVGMPKMKSLMVEYSR